MWGDTESEKAEGSLTSRSAAFVSNLINGNAKDDAQAVNFLGTAMDIGDPLPASLVALLEHRLSHRDSRTNLIEYGCIPKA